MSKRTTKLFERYLCSAFTSDPPRSLPIPSNRRAMSWRTQTAAKGGSDAELTRSSLCSKKTVEKLMERRCSSSPKLDVLDVGLEVTIMHSGRARASLPLLAVAGSSVNMTHASGITGRALPACFFETPPPLRLLCFNVAVCWCLSVLNTVSQWERSSTRSLEKRERAGESGSSRSTLWRVSGLQRASADMPEGAFEDISVVHDP